MPRKIRNANGNGTIRQRADGSWEGRYTLGRDRKTGKQVQKSIYGRTQKEVAAKLRQITVELEDRPRYAPVEMTVGEWFKIWYDEYTLNVKPQTRNLYHSYIETHIKPQLGEIKLSRLSGAMIQRFYNDLIRRDEPLSPKTVKNIHGVLHRGLEQALKNEQIRKNPSANVILPKAEKPELTPLTDEHLIDFLNAIKGHPMERLFLVDLFTGMRRSEIIGLTWDCIDFNKGTITIRRQLTPIKDGSRKSEFTSTKNGKSRVIALAQTVMDILAEQKKAQDEMAALADIAWSNPEGFVFTNEFGQHLAHMTVYHNFKRIVKKIGMPDVRLHDLRHSYAIASLHAGDDIKTLQENLGHHTAAFTLNVYGHVSMQMKRESSKRMDDFIKNISNASQQDESTKNQ